MENFTTYLIVFTIGLFAGWMIYIIIDNLQEGRLLPFKNLSKNTSHIQRTQRYTKNELAVQLATSIVFMLIYYKYGITADFFFFAYIMFILIIMFLIDLKTKIIPDELVIAGIAGGLVVFIYNAFIPLSFYPTANWWEPLVGLLPGSGILFLIAFLGVIIYKSDEVMGMGDVKIFAPIGIFLGWKMCILALVVSMFIGGITSILLILFRIKKRKDTIPFGPFITIAVFITILFGREIWDWYFSWL